ncbi:MAG: type I restriction endonuclease subunit R [Anaerolineae bacterium]|nr:type I restriction endonuclease subunit R [Anaerolineae bacterium]
MTNELHLQDKFLIPFFKEQLGYQEVKANTVDTSLIIVEDLEQFVGETDLNRRAYTTLLRKVGGDRERLLADLVALIQERSASSRNMALFLNANKSVTLHGVKLHLFYTGDSAIHEDALFAQNIFSVVQELPYKYRLHDQQIYAFRPDLVFFVNGIYLGYSELKSNYTSQSARANGRRKVIKDYFDAITAYHRYVDSNAQLTDKEKEFLRRDFLKIFERAIHITTTDIGETYVIRNISDFFDDALDLCRAGRFDREAVEEDVRRAFKPYPLRDPAAGKAGKLAEIFTTHYGKDFIEKEILYYNFIERDVYRVKGRNGGRVRTVRDEKGRLIAPRPKQKFGTDKILSRIDEFLAHEQDDDYFLAQLERQLAGVSASIRQGLIEKRRAYANNRNVYSLLMQYAAGFGKSNIIGWTALQLKDLRRDGDYVYDKIMIVVDRLQLRSQIDAKMINMNIDRRLFVEAHNKTTFQQALASDMRIVIVNLQKFGSIREMLDAEVLQRLAGMRVVFLIDEIHRSHSGVQNEQMISIFDELQTPFDSDAGYRGARAKKNLIIGFTATPDDHTLARFGEFSGYAESEKLWVPFDSYTMLEAIEDGYIHNPIENIVPIASKMIFELPANRRAGLAEPQYKDVEKRQIYENRERIDAIAAYVADLLVKDVYRQIRGQGKAMLAVYSIKAAIAYKDRVTAHFTGLVRQPKYAKYADAPIFIVYSDSQDEQRASSLNEGKSEQTVLEEFAAAKNALIIVVAKLQTGFDDPRLHTLFLDKEVQGIGAIQTISRVNRTTQYKRDCKIVDFSYDNVNVQNIKDAFEHFSNVVVSDFDPFSDRRVLDLLYTELRKSGVYAQFFTLFTAIYKDDARRADPTSFLDLESSLEKYIQAHPERTADTKAKASQYFTILNRIEYVITLHAKYREPDFLHFWQKFNALYLLLRPKPDAKDPIEVYFDNQIGIVEPEAAAPPEKKSKKPTEVAKAKEGRSGYYPYPILALIEARNAHQEEIGLRIQEFAEKITALFDYIRTSPEGERLIVKIKSNVGEDEICDTFARIYRAYRALNRKTVGEAFFKETEDILDKLCDDFERTV